MVRFEDLDAEKRTPPAPETLTPEQIGQVLAQADLLEGWLSAVRKHANAMAQVGVIPPGMKLRQRYGRKRWNVAEADMKTALAIGAGIDENDLYEEPKLKSPAKIKKIKMPRGQKKALEDLVDSMCETPNIGVELVLDSADGEPVGAPLLEQFADLDATETSQATKGDLEWLTM
jgi:hypothetical protein